MDGIIEEANFVHDDKTIVNEFEKSIKQWKNDNKDMIASAQIVSAFQSLSKKLMEPKCPDIKTQGWKQAKMVYKELEHLAGNQIVTGTTDPNYYHEVFYKIFVDWFHYGPGTIHLDLIKSFLHYKNLGMKEFTTSQKGESLGKLFRAITSPIEKKEDTENKPFYQFYRSNLHDFLNLAFDQTQLISEDTTKTMIDFAFHLYLDYTHLEDDCVNEVGRTAKDILKMYATQWKNFSDIPRFKSYLKRFATLAATSGFPRSKAVADLVYEALTTIAKQIQAPGEIEVFSSDMFDLLEVLSQGQGQREHVIRAFTAAVVFFDRRSSVKNQPKVFREVVPRFKTLVAFLDPAFLKDTKCVSDIMTLLENSYADNTELHTEWLSLSVPLIRQPTLKTLNACRNVLKKYDKIKWKEHQDFAHEMLGVIKELTMPSGESKESCLKEITTSISFLLRGLKKARILKNFGEEIMNLSIHVLELKEDDLFDAAEDLGENIEINVKENKEAVMEVMKRLHVVLKDESFPWDKSWPLQRAIVDIMESIFEAVKDGRIFSEEDLRTFTSMCRTCLEKDVVNEESGNISQHFLIFLKIINNLIPWVGDVKQVGIAAELIPLLINILKEDDDNVCNCTARYLSDFATQDIGTIAPFLDDLIKIYLEKEIGMILTPIYTTYSKSPVKISKENFQNLLAVMRETTDKHSQGMLPQIFWSAGKKQAELFTEENLKEIIELAKSSSTYQATLVLAVQEVSKRKPKTLIKHLKLLMNKDGWNPMFLSIINDILSTLTFCDKSISYTILDYFLQCIKTNQDKSVILTALNSVRLLGFKYPDVIKPKRQEIENLQIIDADGQGQKQIILDMVDGKTSEQVKKQLESQQEAMDSLVEKVEDVEGAVTVIGGELEEQKQDLENVKNEVTDQGQRLDQVEEIVEDTVVKVEEIDSKTLSHAPYWSRDISKLLNPATEHDWRLLSSRLGYSNDDIRGWAQQADPCMAMLNEWYATRKTSEATIAILTNLQEMNCSDAVLIVENAMKKAEAVVEDEEFEYASPPPIFISYQWGHQEEAKLLQRHLGMAGYECWLDIGQMGGGDKLFEKIDNGMRAAKLVISCVTTKYAKSPNCNREVNLAVGINKSIIPLLLENCPWPPQGSMGPLFSESLYIPFFKKDNEETKDDRYWPEAKFQELLMQLSVNGLTPDEGKIEPLYKNWWLPLKEEIKIDKSNTRDGVKTAEIVQSEADNKTDEDPEVFISYQWGKQKNIIKLYQRLTSLGFSCWLDIKQMGGGDSLYDKIDRGIRNCKVVVSCVTNKYALSANCRREVSLTDALKKPMLPLLLEEMTWPPSGPMSMVMTQLLYIDFHQESSQSVWEGPQFEQLVVKIKEHLNKNIKSEETTVTETAEEKKCASNTENKSEAANDTISENDIVQASESATEEQKETNDIHPATESSNKLFPPSKETNISGELRPRSAVHNISSQKPAGNSFKDAPLPPPNLRLQTSRSCYIL